MTLLALDLDSRNELRSLTGILRFGEVHCSNRLS
jgi:hypothetical protein